jgi:hypothetical protein
MEYLLLDLADCSYRDLPGIRNADNPIDQE